MTTPSVSLAEIGWDDAWQAEAGAATPRAGTVGRVVRVDRGICAVVTADGLVRASLGSGVLEAMADDTLSTPCTGDWCVLRKWCDGPMTVERVLPRRTSVVRADSSGSSRGQALVANADVVGVVAALRPEPNLGRLERLLTLAWDSGAQPVVLLTKTDLVTDAPLVADDVRSAAPEVDVVCCSAVTGEGIDAVRQLLGGNRTMALLGASGDGKSTLSNALVGTDVLTTMAIRADGKGRHTSVRRELCPLPGGGAVIDTPGLRGVGLPYAEEGLGATFPDIEALAVQCRFNDCTHTQEPGCEVLAAVDGGRIAVRRLESWQKLRREMEWMDTRTDARLRAAQNQQLRRVTRQRRRAGRSDGDP